MPTPDPNAQRREEQRSSLERGPMTGVISVPRGQFGRSSRSITRLPDVTAREVIDKEPVIVNSPPLLPTRREIGDDVSKDIRPDKPRVAKPAVDAKRTGAATRTEKAPLDEKLKNSRMYGNRPPLQTTPAQTTRDTGVGQPQTQRRTGAVERKENTRTRPEVTGETPPIAAPLPKTTPSTRPRTETKSTQPSTSPGNTPPIAAPPSRTEIPSKPSTPPAQTQPRSSTPRATPQQRSTPSQPTATPSKPSTPPAQTQPRSSTPRSTPQPRSTPSQPKATPSKPSTPPARSQPKPSPSKPSAPSKSNDSSRPEPSKSKKP